MGDDDEMYTAIASAPRRDFRITLGLREGYRDESRLHSAQDVLDLHHEWQAVGRRILGVFVTVGTLSYGWPEGDLIRSDAEPACTLTGTFNPLYQTEVTDREAKDMLFELAGFLAANIGQQRVYVEFMGDATILERH